MTYEKLPNESLFQWKERLVVGKIEKEIDLDWSEIKDILGLDISSDHLRKTSAGIYEAYSERKRQELDSESDVQYKETTEIVGGGVQRSDKLIKMSAEQSKDVKYLLEAHGFNPEEWEIVNARNNIWNTNSKTQGVQTLYSSKITVKPKSSGFDMDKLIDVIGQKVEPITVESPKSSTERLLEITLTDLHFGIGDFDYYYDTFVKIKHKIKSKKWDTILFVIGSDMLHNDGFTGKTTSGTMIDKVDMQQAWQDADKFYSLLMIDALENAKHVKGIYSDGNHDQGISFGFVKMLEAKFHQVDFDSTIRIRKGFKWKDVFLGFTHGHMGGKRIPQNFYTEFGNEIAVAKVKEIHCGHLHHEKSRDDLGLVIRTLATAAKSDDYHIDNGWIGANKTFQLFEYSPAKLEAIYYI